MTRIIVRAIPADAASLTQIAIAAKRVWNYPERWIEHWIPSLTITPEFISSAEVWKAAIGEVPVGFYALTFGGGKAILEHLWVSPRSIGQGIGRALFEHAVSQCRDHRAVAMEIDSDPNAQGFYERMGAPKIGERESDLFGEPRILPIMRLDLTKKCYS